MGKEKIKKIQKKILEKSKKIIDLRYLQQIRKVEDFLELIEWLDSFEMKKNEK